MDHLTSLEWIIQTRRCKAYITHDHMQPYSHLPETTRIELNQPSQMSLSIKYQLMKQGCLFHVCSLYQIHIMPPFSVHCRFLRTQRVWVTVKIRKEREKQKKVFLADLMSKLWVSDNRSPEQSSPEYLTWPLPLAAGGKRGCCVSESETPELCAVPHT